MILLTKDNDDSLDSSREDNSQLHLQQPQGKSKKILNFIDKISASKYFQQVNVVKYCQIQTRPDRNHEPSSLVTSSPSPFFQATELGVIKKAMSNVSNTRLILSVCVESLRGTLALNVPPFPTDRLWWGFVEEPKLQLSVTPRVGDKEIALTQITEWIQSRLKVGQRRSNFTLGSVRG